MLPSGALDRGQPMRGSGELHAAALPTSRGARSPQCEREPRDKPADTQPRLAEVRARRCNRDRCLHGSVKVRV